MPEEKIDTKEFGSIEAYLIESRSIGGLSGSPVFVHLGQVRLIDGQLKHATNNVGIFYLLGLIHGHFDKNDQLDDFTIEDENVYKINTGIAIVVPATKILEIINQPAWIELRNKITDESKQK